MYIGVRSGDAAAHAGDSGGTRNNGGARGGAQGGREEERRNRLYKGSIKALLRRFLRLY